MPGGSPASLSEFHICFSGVVVDIIWPSYVPTVANKSFRSSSGAIGSPQPAAEVGLSMFAFGSVPAEGKPALPRPLVVAVGDNNAELAGRRSVNKSTSQQVLSSLKILKLLPQNERILSELLVEFGAEVAKPYEGEGCRLGHKHQTTAVLQLL